MKTMIDSLREIIGTPNFYIDGSWDYGAMIEYFVCAVILCIVVSSVFRFIGKLVSR